MTAWSDDRRTGAARPPTRTAPPSPPAHGKSYHLATRLLTPDRRAAVHALYAAARTADDLVDLPGADPAGDLGDLVAAAARPSWSGAGPTTRSGSRWSTPTGGTTSRSSTWSTSWPP